MCKNIWAIECRVLEVEHRLHVQNFNLSQKVFCGLQSAVCSLRFHPTGPRRGLGRRTKTVVVKTKYLFSYTQCAYNLGHRLSTCSQELTQ